MGRYKILYQSIERDGKLRNEDRVLFWETCFYNGQKITLLAVADGVGSLKQSDLAAQRAIEGLVDWVFRECRYLLVTKKEMCSDTLLCKWSGEEILREAFREANRRVCGVGKEVGTTLSAALIVDDEMAIANMGDSPIYYFDGERLELVSELHLEQETHLLLKCLGESEQFDVNQVFSRTLGKMKTKDFLLLGSDGAFGSLTEEEILDVIQHASTVELLDRLFAKSESHDDQSAVYCERICED